MRVAVAGATGLVGRRLVQAARQAGHDVLELSRSSGVDLTACPTLDLCGVDAVIDVTNAPSLDQDEATAFFTAVAETLGRAATSAGVPHTVVLSIIEVDKTPENGYFIAKLAHERATCDYAPQVRVLRSAQFHDFARQILAWRREGDTAAIPDRTIQPVDLDEVVRVLLELATSADDAALTELAGPQPERLPDMVARLDPSVTVRPQPVNDAAPTSALQPGPDTIIAGPTFEDWLARNR